MLICREILQSLSQWNNKYCWELNQGKKPYLTYNIKIETSKISSYTLSEYQLSLYQKICELRFDENLYWKQIADRLNKEGWKGTYGAKFSGGSCSSVYQKCRRHFEKKHKFHPPDLDDVELVWK